MTDIVVNLAVAPNILKLNEELDILSLGTYLAQYPAVYPGDLTVSYEATLSSADQTSVTNTVTSHDSTQKTAEQNRKDQDTTDLDSIRADYDAATDWDTLTAAQRTTAIQEMRRCILRLAGNEAI